MQRLDAEVWVHVFGRGCSSQRHSPPTLGRCAAKAGSMLRRGCVGDALFLGRDMARARHCRSRTCTGLLDLCLHVGRAAFYRDGTSPVEMPTDVASFSPIIYWLWTGSVRSLRLSWQQRLFQRRLQPFSSMDLIFFSGENNDQKRTGTTSCNGSTKHRQAEGLMEIISL